MKTFVPLLLYLPTLILAGSASKLEVQKKAESKVASNQLQQIYEQTKHMKYGKCWTKALEELKTGCRSLTDESQRRIAYAFARCHLQSAGRDIPECPKETAISDCTSESALKDAAFNAYTEFFTHTQQICFHLQSQVWHEATENTISRLADNSAEVADNLEQSSNATKELMIQQNATLRNQEIVLRNERALRENMQKSHEETKHFLSEQRLLFAEVFDRVAALQKTVLGEFTSLYTFGYYIGAAILAYVLTSTPQTSSARCWLFIELTLNIVTERAIVNYHMSANKNKIAGYPDDTVSSETIYKDMWRCRNVYTTLAFITMFISFVRYKDYLKINNNLLNDIKRQNEQLQTLLKESGINITHNNTQQNNTSDGTNNNALAVVPSNHRQDFNEETNKHHQLSVITNSIAETNNSTVTSFFNSQYETEDDHTFVAEDSGSEFSFSSNRSTSGSRSLSGSSRRSSHRSDDIRGMLRSFRRSSTPQRDVGISHSPASQGRSRISSTNLIMEHLNENMADVNGVIIGGYNLRQRKGSPCVNPIVQRESAKEFAMAVARITLDRKRLFR